MFDERNMKLWEVQYTDKYGNKQRVRYCATTKDGAASLFRSEQQKGEVLKSIKEVKGNG